MGRTRELIDQLRKGPDPSGQIRATEGDFQVYLKLSDWDRLGCLLETLRIRHAGDTPFAFDAGCIAEKVTYLGERLRVIEVEPGDRAVLRSHPPCSQEGTVSFFEMVVDSSQGLSLTRQSFEREGGQRQLISAHLTRQALERLLADLVGLLRGSREIPPATGEGGDVGRTQPGRPASGSLAHNVFATPPPPVSPRRAL